MGAKHVVVCQPPQWFGDGLRNQQAVEGVAVQHRQGLDCSGMLGPDVEKQVACLSEVAQCRCGGNRDAAAPEHVLDGEFPDAGSGHRNIVVGIGDGGAGVGSQAAVVG